MLSIVGLAILRGPIVAARDVAQLLTTGELRDLVADLIEELDRRDPDPDAEPDSDAEPDQDGETDHDAEPPMLMPSGGDWRHQASGELADQTAERPTRPPVRSLRTGESPAGAAHGDRPGSRCRHD